jgi:hypothetical protein
MLLALPSAASAAYIPPLICTGLPGCNNSNFPGLLGNGIPVIGSVLVGLAAGLSVVAVLYGGLLMLLSVGDEGRVTKGKNSIMYGLGGLALALSAQSLVSFLVTEPLLQFRTVGGTLGPIQGLLIAAVTIGVNVFNALLILVVLYAGFRLVYARGKSEDVKKGISTLKYAFIGAVVANLSRALVEAFISMITW